VARPGGGRARPGVEGAADAEGGGGRLTDLAGVVHDDRVQLAGRGRDSRLAGHDDRALDRARLCEREQHVGDHRAGELESQRVGDARAEAALGVVEALDWEDGGGPHGWLGD
jgi:hypothetical protein